MLKLDLDKPFFLSCSADFCILNKHDKRQGNNCIFIIIIDVLVLFDPSNTMDLLLRNPHVEKPTPLERPHFPMQKGWSLKGGGGVLYENLPAYSL